MARDLKTLIRYEANRRPHLAALVKNIGNMSVSDIQNSKVDLPWMRNALLELKSESDYALLSISIENYISDGFVKSSDGDVWEMRSTRFVKIGRSDIQINEGDLLWFPKTGGVWIDSLFGQSYDPIVMSLSRLVTRCSREDYRRMVQKHLLGKSSGITQTIVDDVRPESASPFTIKCVPRNSSSW